MSNEDTPRPDEGTPTTRATEHDDDTKVPRPAAGHTWGAAVTSLVGPTEETREAVDPEEPRVLERRSVEELLQDAIDAVMASHGGTHSRDVVTDALQRELEARGRWPQPSPWLEAVATEIEAGGAYTVGTGRPAAQDAAEGDPGQRR